MEVFLSNKYPELKINDPDQVKTPDKGEAEGKKDPLLQACQEFESIFIFYMFKAMRGTVPEGGLLPRGMGEDIFQGMMDEEIAKKASRNEDYGLARLMYEQINRVNVLPGD